MSGDSIVSKISAFVFLYFYNTLFVDLCQQFYLKRKRVNSIVYNLFIAEVKKQLSLKKWTYEDLAKKTGFKIGTIKAFMCGYRESDNVAQCISKVLDIDL